MNLRYMRDRRSDMRDNTGVWGAVTVLHRLNGGYIHYGVTLSMNRINRYYDRDRIHFSDTGLKSRNTTSIVFYIITFKKYEFI
jgi:hypothetical protein